MTATNEEDIYQVEKPEGYTHIQFCRTTTTMFGSESVRETSRIEIPTDGRNLFTITDGGNYWRDATGEWSTK